jgi:3-deoxy-D-manno-octulosonic acid kinase
MTVIRRAVKDSLVSETVCQRNETPGQRSPLRGRGNIRTIGLTGGGTALVRRYRRGGMVRLVTSDLFFTWPPRPFAELRVTETASRRGVPTPEVLAACVERVWGPFYRGWLVTRQLAGAEDLWAALQRRDFLSGEKIELIRSVALAVRKMHRAGVDHADLNLKNILVRSDARQIQCYVIDFDKARLCPREVSPKRAANNLRRLLRSVAKLDSGRDYLTHDDWEVFLNFYRGRA